jgi:signal transduction histidine kinase
MPDNEGTTQQETTILERRTNQLRIVTKIAAEIARQHDINSVFETTVRLICERLGYYHTGIFIIDTETNHAVLRAAIGDRGQTLLSEGYKLSLHNEDIKRGIVGVVASTGEPLIALDIGQNTFHLRNKHLPDTRSEIAVPISINGNEPLGVLDIQSTEPNAFSQEDILTFKALADIIGVAIESTTLLQNLLHNEQRTTQIVTLVMHILGNLSSSLQLNTTLSNMFIDDREKLQECLASLTTDTELLARLSKNVGMLIDILSGKYTTEPANISSLSSIKQAIDTNSVLAHERNIEILQSNAQSPLFIASEVDLTEALNRILQNAIEHTDPGNTVKISVTKQPVDGYIGISVTDQGPGIPPEEIALLSNPLFVRRGEMQSGANFKIGFGLAIAKALIELNNGKLSIESEVGVGSTFTVWLPISQPESATVQ